MKKEYFANCLILAALSSCLIGLISGCNFYSYETRRGNDSEFKDDFEPAEWSEVFLVLKRYEPIVKVENKSLAVLDDGSICFPKDRFSSFKSDFGFGVGLTPLFGGLMACGGNFNLKATCCFWYSDSKLCHFFQEFSPKHEFGLPGKMVTDNKWVDLQTMFILFPEGINPPGVVRVGIVNREPLELKFRNLALPSGENVPEFPLNGACLVMDKLVLYVIGGMGKSGKTLKGTWILPFSRDYTELEWTRNDEFPEKGVLDGGCMYERNKERLWYFGGQDKFKDGDSEGTVYQNSSYADVTRIGPVDFQFTVGKGPSWSEKLSSIISFQLADATGDYARTFLMGIVVGKGDAKSKSELRLVQVTSLTSTKNLDIVKGRKTEATEFSGVVLPRYSLPECIPKKKSKSQKTRHEYKGKDADIVIEDD